MSDHPQCVDKALAAFGRSINDRLRDDERQLLKPLIPKLVGTAGSRKLMRRRAYLLVDRHVRSIGPAFLRDLPNKPRPDLAERFESLPPIVDDESARRARDLAREVRDAARANVKDSSAYTSASYSYAAARWRAATIAAAAAFAAAAAAAADADAAAYAAADAAYAAAAAAAADAAAYAAADADDQAFADLRRSTIERSIAAFVEAIELTEAA